MQIWNGSTTPPNELVGEDSHAYEVGQRIEDYADNLMTECLTLKGAEVVYKSGDFDELLPQLMVAIANWTGRSDSSDKQMRKLHNLLSDEFQKIARRKVS